MCDCLFAREEVISGETFASFVNFHDQLAYVFTKSPWGLRLTTYLTGLVHIIIYMLHRNVKILLIPKNSIDSN